MSHYPKTDDPKVQAHIEKAMRRDHRTNFMFRRALHVIERIIALLTLLALVCALVVEAYHMCTAGMEYFQDMSHMLHNLLTIVVGLALCSRYYQYPVPTYRITRGRAARHSSYVLP